MHRPRQPSPAPPPESPPQPTAIDRAFRVVERISDFVDDITPATGRYGIPEPRLMRWLIALMTVLAPFCFLVWLLK
jgi:hypothetical protein